jgi:hypothetical protein
LLAKAGIQLDVIVIDIGSTDDAGICKVSHMFLGFFDQKEKRLGLINVNRSAMRIIK